MNIYKMMQQNPNGFGTADHLAVDSYGYVEWNEQIEADTLEEIAINAAYDVDRRDWSSRPQWNFFG